MVSHSRLCLVSLAILAWSACQAVPPASERDAGIAYRVTTFCGNGTAGYADGTGGRDGTAEFHWPSLIALDSKGRLFVADAYNNRIRLVARDGSVTTFTGSGLPGGYGFYDGTGGPTGSSVLCRPRGVAIAPGGIVFADSANVRVRLADMAGNTTTLSGDGVVGYLDGTGGPLSNTEMNYPEGVALAADGTIFFVDHGNHRIRRLDPRDNAATVAGNGIAGYVDGTGGSTGSAEFDFPEAIAIGPDGLLYVSDGLNGSIRRVDPTTGATSTFVGDGTSGYADGVGTTARFGDPVGIAFDASEALWVADAGNRLIRRVDRDGRVVTIAGDGKAGDVDGSARSAEFVDPEGIAVGADGRIFVSDTGANRIRVIERAP